MAESQATAPARTPQPKQTGLRRHHRTLTFVGAIIVFFTFVVKEGLREQLKGLVDSIEYAESVYLIRGDVDDLRTRVIAIGTQLDLSQPLTLAQKGKDFSSIQYDDNYILRDDSSAVELEIMSRLSDKVGNSTVSKTIEEVKKRRHELADYQSEANGLRTSDADEQEVKKMIAVARSHIDTESRSIEIEISKVAELVAQESRKAKDEAERRYKIATWASYSLYTLGWGLGLVGRLAGVNAGGDD